MVTSINHEAPYHAVFSSLWFQQFHQHPVSCSSHTAKHQVPHPHKTAEGQAIFGDNTADQPRFDAVSLGIQSKVAVLYTGCSRLGSQAYGPNASRLSLKSDRPGLLYTCTSHASRSSPNTCTLPHSERIRCTFVHCDCPAVPLRYMPIYTPFQRHLLLHQSAYWHLTNIMGYSLLPP